MMIIVLIRIILDMACMAWAIFGGLFYFIIGDTQQALVTVFISGILAFFIRPNNVDMARFKQFQEERLAKLPPPSPPPE